MSNIENGFVGHEVFVYVKYMHMHHLLLAFHTRTTLAILLGNFISGMNLALHSISTSSSMAVLFSSPTFCFLYVTSLVDGWMGVKPLTTVVLILGMSKGAHVNRSKFHQSRSTSSRSSLTDKDAPIFVT